MIDEYIPLAILFILAIGLAFLVIALGHLFGPRRPTGRKAQPYESGMKPIGPGTRRISVRFYLVAVLFILFDVEIVFFLPWAVTLRNFVARGLGIFAFIEMTVFIIILMAGYIYAWKKGAMEWE
jgi:NADH-quinone oxidoreductase subunit A